MRLSWFLLHAFLVSCYLPLYSGLLDSLTLDNKRYTSTVAMVEYYAKDAVKSASEMSPARVHLALRYARGLMFTPVQIMLKVCREELKDEIATKKCREIAESMNTDSGISFLELELRRIQVRQSVVGRSVHHLLFHMQKCRKTYYMTNEHFKDVQEDGLMRILGNQRLLLFYQSYYELLSRGDAIMGATALGIRKLLFKQRHDASSRFPQIIPQLMKAVRKRRLKPMKGSGILPNSYDRLQLDVESATHITKIMLECVLRMHNHEMCLKMEDQLEYTILSLQKVPYEKQSKNI